MTRALVLLLAACGRVGFDATDPDASPDSAPLAPLCERVGTPAYCSDFEGGTIAGATDLGGQADPGGGYDGSDGWLFLSAPGTMPLLRIPTPAPATAMFVGGRMRFEGTSEVTDYVVLAQAISPDFEKISYDATFEDRIQLVSTVNQVGIGQQSADDSLPRDTWFCWELQIHLASAGGRIIGLVDGDPVHELSDVDTQPMNGFYAFELGAMSSSDNESPAIVHLDNLVSSDEPIGCP